MAFLALLSKGTRHSHRLVLTRSSVTGFEVMDDILPSMIMPPEDISS
jgi:hypothetical protein